MPIQSPAISDESSNNIEKYSNLKNWVLAMYAETNHGTEKYEAR